MRATSFTLGFNFDDGLVDVLQRLGDEPHPGQISEVFGALAESPVPSARLTTSIPRIDRRKFASQLARLRASRIDFNYLMNTNEPLRGNQGRVVRFLSSLWDDGVSHVTVGTSELASLIRAHLPAMHITMSITRGVKSPEAIQAVAASGCDACYLDGVFVNRNFALLRRLIDRSPIEIRLYANMSCISACPVVRQHYGAFASQDASAAAQHESFFAGCSLVKMRSPVEWIQMPWIRPEDVSAYRSLGVEMFKLSDRLAPTPVLARIARAYVSGVSPSDLFDIIERSGAKYHQLTGRGGPAPSEGPYRVDPEAIPDEFFRHFEDSRCVSQDTSCPVCTEVAHVAVKRNVEWDDFELDPAVEVGIPRLLAARVVA